MHDKPLVLLVGPTAVGKTATSIKLAKAINGEIISGDSMQVFRGFDIGTAKITPNEMMGIPHHLIDIKPSDGTFNVTEFKELVDKTIADILSRGKIPMIVGGTGFYINSVIYQYTFGQATEDLAYRSTLQEILKNDGGVAILHQMLEAVDKVSAQKLHMNDTKRIIRALEVYHVTGRAVSESESGVDKSTPRYKMMYQGLTMERATLYQRINQRVDMMLADHWLEEVESLLAQGVPQNCQGMQGLGYRQLVMYINGEISKEQAVELIKRDTRHFAKRQLTWFRHDPHLRWIHKDDQTDEETLSALLENIREIL